MREKQVTLSDGKTVIVKKLPVGKFGELLLAVESAFTKIKPYLASLEDVEKMSNHEFAMTVLPKVIADALPEALTALSLGTDLTAAELEELGIDEVSDILVAFMETNDIKKLFDNIKKVLTPLGINEKLASKNGSSASPTNSPASTTGAAKKS